MKQTIITLILLFFAVLTFAQTNATFNNLDVRGTTKTRDDAWHYGDSINMPNISAPTGLKFGHVVGWINGTGTLFPFEIGDLVDTLYAEGIIDSIWYNNGGDAWLALTGNVNIPDSSMKYQINEQDIMGGVYVSSIWGADTSGIVPCGQQIENAVDADGFRVVEFFPGKYNFSDGCDLSSLTPETNVYFIVHPGAVLYDTLTAPDDNAPNALHFITGDYQIFDSAFNMGLHNQNIVFPNDTYKPVYWGAKTVPDRSSFGAALQAIANIIPLRGARISWFGNYKLDRLVRFETGNITIDGGGGLTKITTNVTDLEKDGCTLTYVDTTAGILFDSIAGISAGYNTGIQVRNLTIFDSLGATATSTGHPPYALWFYKPHTGVIENVYISDFFYGDAIRFGEPNREVVSSYKVSNLAIRNCYQGLVSLGDCYALQVNDAQLYNSNEQFWDTIASPLIQKFVVTGRNQFYSNIQLEAQTDQGWAFYPNDSSKSNSYFNISKDGAGNVIWITGFDNMISNLARGGGDTLIKVTDPPPGASYASTDNIGFNLADGLIVDESTGSATNFWERVGFGAWYLGRAESQPTARDGWVNDYISLFGNHVYLEDSTKLYFGDQSYITTDFRKKITLTGNSGTANVTAGGLTRLATWNASLTQTATDFVTSWAADYLAAGYLVSAQAGVLFFATTTYGYIAVAPSIANVSGTLNGNPADASRTVWRVVDPTEDLRIDMNKGKLVVDNSRSVVGTPDDYPLRVHSIQDGGGGIIMKEDDQTYGWLINTNEDMALYDSTAAQYPVLIKKSSGKSQMVLNSTGLQIGNNTAGGLTPNTYKLTLWQNSGGASTQKFRNTQGKWIIGMNSTEDFVISDSIDEVVTIFDDAPASVLTIEATTGDVGINDLTPEYDFDVNGTARITGQFRLDTKTAVGSRDSVLYIENNIVCHNYHV